MAERALRVMLVDDEPLAVDRLQLLLAKLPDVAVVGTAHDGEAALRIVEAVAPDAVFLDISMPGMSGIDVAQALAGTPVVFITAFDNFAVAAFDLAAIDYLMKPVGKDRLARALDRVRAHIAAARPLSAPPARTAHVEEFWVPDHNGLVRIAAIDIQRVTAERDYMRLHVGARTWLIHRTIARLEEELDPALFLRVHRSVILRRNMIAGLYRDEAGHWTARLTDGSEQRIGRSYVDDVKRFAGHG